MVRTHSIFLDESFLCLYLQYHCYPFLFYLFVFRKMVPFHCHYMTSLFYFVWVTLIIVAWANTAAIILSHFFIWKLKQTKVFITNSKNSQLNQYKAFCFFNNLKLKWSKWLICRGQNKGIFFLPDIKFTNLLKSLSLFSLFRKFWLFSLLDHWKMAFPHLKGKVTLLEKTSKWKYQKLFTSQIFFFLCAVCTAILSSNWKNNNTIFMVSEI